MDIRAKTCCFTGHRSLSGEEKLKAAVRLRRVIEEQIKAGIRLSALNSTGLDVVKVHFIGQRKMYHNGTVKVVPLCIRRKQQANPSRRP